MRTRTPQTRIRPSEMLAYGCVGSAVIFIFALTFGAFERHEQPRDFVSNITEYSSASTP